MKLPIRPAEGKQVPVTIAGPHVAHEVFHFVQHIGDDIALCAEPLLNLGEDRAVAVYLIIIRKLSLHPPGLLCPFYLDVGAVTLTFLE